MDVILYPFFFLSSHVRRLDHVFIFLIFLGQPGTESRYGIASRVSRTDCEGILHAADQYAGCTEAFTHAREVSLPVQPQRLYQSFPGNAIQPFA